MAWSRQKLLAADWKDRTMRQSMSSGEYSQFNARTVRNYLHESFKRASRDMSVQICGGHQGISSAEAGGHGE